MWACATMLVGLAQSFAALLALRLLLGIGESAGFPAVSKLLATVVPVESLGTANGIVAFAYLLGPAVGAYCGGLIMVEFGWRAAFWVFGGLSLLWLLPWSRVELQADRADVREAQDRRQVADRGLQPVAARAEHAAAPAEPHHRTRAG